MSETRAANKRKQMSAFAGHLLSFPTVTEAAKATGISSRTATRWLKSAEFKQIYVSSREATLLAITGMLRQSSVGACEALAAVVRDPESAPTARTAAARAILDSLRGLMQDFELESRLAQLETLAAEKGRS